MWILELLASVMFCWALTNAVHEGSHLLVGYLKYDLEPKGFYPFAHWYNDAENKWRAWRPWELHKKPEGYDRLIFARYRARGPWPLGSGELLHIAPLYSDILFFVLGAIYLVLSPSIFGSVFIICFEVDALVWGYTYCRGNKHTDGYKYRYGVEPDTIT